MTDKVPLVPPKSKAAIEIDTELLMEKIRSRVVSPDSFEVDIEKIYEIILPELIPGLRTGYIDLSDLGLNVMGVTDAQRKVSFVHKELSDATDMVTRRRFRATVAHEVSHCVFHLRYLRSFRSLSSKGDELYRVSRTEIKPYRDPEWQAWKYAGAILMPKAQIEKMIQKGYGIDFIAGAFDVNPAFVRARIGSLKK